MVLLQKNTLSYSMDVYTHTTAVIPAISRNVSARILFNVFHAMLLGNPAGFNRGIQWVFFNNYIINSSIITFLMLGRLSEILAKVRQ